MIDVGMDFHKKTTTFAQWIQMAKFLVPRGMVVSARCRLALRSLHHWPCDELAIALETGITALGGWWMCFAGPGLSLWL